MGTWLLMESCGVAGLISKPFGYRGLNRYCRVAGHLLRPREVSMRIHDRVVLQVRSSDPYWLSLTPRCRTYEPEVEALLQEFTRDQATFLDCGANVGYWSIFAAHNPAWRVLAVEASPRTFAQLECNIELNRVPVVAINKAVSERSGEEVQFATVSGHHAGAHITEVAEDDAVIDRITTLSVDDLVDEYDGSGLLILKLDVEGHELQALRGAQATLSKTSMVVYEEHGSRTECVPSQELLAQGFSVFFLEASGPIPVRSLADIVPRMRLRGVGYNLVATRSAAIIERLQVLGLHRN